MIMQMELLMNFLKSLVSRYQIGLEISMGWRDFASDSVQLLYCKCHKTNLERGKSYINPPDWIK